MFQETYRAWRAYREQLPEDLPSQQTFVCAEVDRRLRDLTWVVEQVRLAYEAHTAAFSQAVDADAQFKEAFRADREPWRDDQMPRMSEMSTRMRVHAEYFYWSTGRIRRGLRELPGLKKFDVVGPRDVRNRVMEHPEPYDGWDSGMAAIMGGSLLMSPNEWVILARPPAVHLTTHVADAGLRTNAQEFRDALDSAFASVLGTRRDTADHDSR